MGQEQEEVEALSALKGSVDDDSLPEIKERMDLRTTSPKEIMKMAMAIKSKVKRDQRKKKRKPLNQTERYFQT